MLPFLNKKRITDSIMQSPESQEQPAEDELVSHAKDLADALKEGDAVKVAAALRAAHQHLQNSNSSED